MKGYHQASSSRHRFVPLREEKHLWQAADLSVQVIIIGMIVQGVIGSERLNVATIALHGIAQVYRLPAMVTCRDGAVKASRAASV